MYVCSIRIPQKKCALCSSIIIILPNIEVNHAIALPTKVIVLDNSLYILLEVSIIIVLPNIEAQLLQ